MILALITTVSFLANFILLWFLCAYVFCITYSSTGESEPETRPEPEPEPTIKYEENDHAELKSDESPHTFLFKIKFGKTLKRLSVPIFDGNLNTNMDNLRDMITYIFDLPRYTELKMSYIDEDEEEITMTDENDLMDIMTQKKLQYRLWMYVELKNIQASTKAIRVSRTERCNKTTAPVGLAGLKPIRVSNTFGSEYDETETETDVLSPIDIELVMTLAGVSRNKAVTAIKTHDGDIVSAIMELTA
ncbi:hypothetical protein DCAR_0518806 [Daucus carota subsp. sativus]|uniref:Uncharacterized protein n=1 Tax=Daucus carota subsp. sativus TaxID=79200 RepID=A0A164XI33_DAUCS|nr:hypothetical protein DCAR_0518806 [Daucus carota subsp. sativus]